MHKILKSKIVIIMILMLAQIASAQTTGKISGRVVDRETGDPLLGANVLLQKTMLGAAVDIDGEYYIINIPPGKYDVKVSMMGYSPITFEGVSVSVNRTTTINAELSMEDITLNEVVVAVDAISNRKDQTSSVKNISSDQINTLPVENVTDVVNLQAGVVQGHFRGGRSTEVSYLVDGVSVTDGFNRENYGVEIETEAVQDMEVITGTFNAEYGRAMSGIVNIVTKEGGKEFSGSASGFISGYPTTADDIFIGVESTDLLRNQDYKVQFEGPLYEDYVTFFTNARFENYDGYLNGIRRFNVNDYSDFDHANILSGTATPWDYDLNGTTYYSEHTGDEDYVPMAASEKYSVMGKLTFRFIPGVKFSLMYSGSDQESQSYNHLYKYKPDGRATDYTYNDFYLFQFNHILSNSMFHDLKVSYNKMKNEEYLYNDPFDSRYVADNYDGNTVGGFYTGGQDKGYYGVKLYDLNVKYDLTWQITNHHSIKTGFEFTKHDLEKSTVIVQDVKTGSSEIDDFYYDPATEKIIFNPYEPEILTDAITSDNYSKNPYEYSFYLQDKMEYDALVMNFGLRYDYFNSNTVYPTQLRNPGNQLSYPDNPERMSEYLDADAQEQISPRFGLSYSLGKTALLRFSYGHFFQMPPLYALYQNSKFLVPAGDYGEPIHGNPNLKAEKTVQYEMGFWQQVTDNIGVEVAVFYRDIYDLLTTNVITTYNQIKYGRYANKDYGNAKGLELKFDYFNDPFSVFLNYTLQYTRGNADDPTTSYTRAGDNLGTISTLIPLAWDQRHTLNINAGYKKENYGISLIGTFNSGSTYTYEPVDDNPLSKVNLYPNNAYKPATFDISLKSNYDLKLTDNIKMRFSLLVYNLLDTRNEIEVDESTGRAYSTILTSSQIATFKSNYNDIYDLYEDPSMYSAPREVKIGIGIVF